MLNYRWHSLIRTTLFFFILTIDYLLACLFLAGFKKKVEEKQPSDETYYTESELYVSLLPWRTA